MPRLRSLAACHRAAHALGLEPWWGAAGRDLLFTCPICREAGLKANACITQNEFGISPRCRGCEMWDDDPWGPFEWLQCRSDPEAKSAAEHLEGRYAIPVAVLNLLWAIEKERRRGGA